MDNSCLLIIHFLTPVWVASRRDENSTANLLWLDSADILVFSSAFHGRGLDAEPQMECSQRVALINRVYGSLFITFAAHANRVGFEDGLLISESRTANFSC